VDGQGFEKGLKKGQKQFDKRIFLWIIKSPTHNTQKRPQKRQNNGRFYKIVVDDN